MLDLIWPRAEFMRGIERLARVAAAAVHAWLRAIRRFPACSTPFALCALLAATALAPASAETARGLVAEYDDGSTVIHEVALAPSFYLDGEESIHPALSPAFSARWAGRISIFRNGRYRFYPGESQLWLDGERVGTETVDLIAGSHQIEVRYRRSAGPARLRLEWHGPTFAREPIRAGLFSHHVDQGPSAKERLVQEGRRLAQELGCINCHAAGSSALEASRGPVLTDLGSRLKSPWIKAWLERPTDFRPSATMPEMLSARGRADVAAFLAEQGGDNWPEQEYHRSYEEKGRTTFQAFGCAACHGRGGISLDGLGSKATIESLQRYLQDPLRFTPDGRMPDFHLSDREALELAAYLALSRNSAFEFAAAPGDAARGRELIESSGCLACHRLQGFTNTRAAPRFGRLDAKSGCLADQVPGGLPRFRLEAGPREALQAFVAWYKVHPDRSPSPIHAGRERTARLRCGACHERDGVPASGVLAESAPPLTGVGDKLQARWIRRVLSEETHVLGWQKLRMPSFGPQNANLLAASFAASAGVGLAPRTPATIPPEEVRERGHGMLGTNSSAGGLGCIGCHGWDAYPSLGENGPELSTAANRLRPDWFKRWMRDPARILSGTSMPNYFASAEPDQAKASIDALWAALVSAKSATPPTGFKTEQALQGGEAMPHPEDEAIVVRWDMPEATPSAIAVGLPGGASYCFDAGESRLRYAWLGGFVDLSSTLLKKTNKETGLTETAQIVGDIFFREGNYPIRVGNRDRIPQRRFRGYRLVDSYPQFHYQADGVDIYELILPSERGQGIRRLFEIPKVSEPMWLVVAQQDGVEIRSSLGVPEGGLIEIPQGTGIAFEVSVLAKP